MLYRGTLKVVRQRDRARERAGLHHDRDDGHHRHRVVQGDADDRPRGLLLLGRGRHHLGKRGGFYSHIDQKDDGSDGHIHFGYSFDAGARSAVPRSSAPLKVTADASPEPVKKGKAITSPAR